MNRLRILVFLLLAVPGTLAAQGLRMSADFLPLAVGNRWVYDVTNQEGRKIAEFDFSVSEHTIQKGRSFYVLSRFPFALVSGSEIHLVRYDKAEKQFLRVLDDQEGSLFIGEAAAAEVVEADTSGLPLKFIYHGGNIDLTFQRGVGIIEARIQGGNGIQIAKISSARVGEGVAPPSTAAAAKKPGPNVDRPTPAQQAGIPQPKPPERKPRPGIDNVGSITDDNPLLILEAGETSEGHKFVLTVKNISDKLLPFSFTSGQSYDFAVIDPATGQEIWRWSRHMFFVTQVRRTEAIAPNGQWKFEIPWNNRDNDLNKVAPGSYQVVGFIATQPAIESETITILVK